MNEIEKEFMDLANSLYADEIDIEGITENDIKMWGYDSWDDFWESNI